MRVRFFSLFIALMMLIAPVLLGGDATTLRAQEGASAVGVQDLAEEDPLEDDTVLGTAQYLPVAQMTIQQHFIELGLRFGMNFLASFLIVGILYFRKSRRRDYYFTLMVFSTAMLLLLAIMENVSIGIGLTLGLFAIFGVIRYRTETVPIREMTYLFVIIAVAAINGLAPLYREVGTTGMSPHFELDTSIVVVMLITNALIICVIAIFESELIGEHSTTKLILYDKIDLIVPEKREELIADIEKRVGVKVLRIEIGHVDFLRDAAFIKVSYDLGRGETNTINMLTKEKNYVG